MFNYLVLGAGKMGVILAKDLLESDKESRVTLVDIDFERLKTAAEFISSGRLVPIQRDIEDREQRGNLFEGFHVCLCALLHKHSLMSMEASIAAGVHFVDLIGEFTLEKQKKDEEAKRRGITVLSGLGVSPGITNVCVGRGVRLLDQTEDVLVFVGGNPVHPIPPLKYRIVYAVNSLLNLYARPVPLLKKGQAAEVAPLSGVEPISFSPPFQDMECFYTDGLNSLFYTMSGKISGELSEKTVRHRGHAEGIGILKECGLFSEEAINIDGCDIVPRRILEAVLDERLFLGEERDVTLMRILVKGSKSGKAARHVFEMEDLYDEKNRFTSMAKTTGFPASIAARMIAEGQITRRGVLFPEHVFDDELYDPFIAELGKRGVIVKHSQLPGADY